VDAVSIDAERRQEPGSERGWAEVHRVDAWAEDASLAVTWSVTARPGAGTAGFSAAVVEAGRAPVVLVDHDVELPPASWELRTSGLWADHICETPLEHWSYGLEAFALEIEDPAELRGRAVGHRLPLGWELEFEASAAAEWHGPDAYRQHGEVHGLVLVGRRRLDVELRAVRHHWWGTAPPPPLQGSGDPASGAVALPEPGGCWWVALGPDGLEVTHQR
jgi:hypothetical protein